MDPQRKELAVADVEINMINSRQRARENAGDAAQRDIPLIDQRRGHLGLSGGGHARPPDQLRVQLQTFLSSTARKPPSLVAWAVSPTQHRGVKNIRNLWRYYTSQTHHQI